MHSVSIDLVVDDPQALLKVARERAAEEGLTEEEAEELLLEDGEPNVSGCLTMLLDPGSLPGCSLLNSSVEYYDTPKAGCVL